MFFLSILLGGLIASAFIKDSNTNLDSNFSISDISAEISCDTSSTWYNTSKFITITSQEDLNEYNCSYSDLNELKLNEGLILVKGYMVTANDEFDLVNISVENEINSAVVFSIYESTASGVDLYSLKEFYIYIFNEDLNGREIIFQ